MSVKPNEPKSKDDREAFRRTLQPTANSRYLRGVDERGDGVYYDLAGNEFTGDIDDPTDPDMKLQYGPSPATTTDQPPRPVSPLPPHQEQIRFRVDRDLLEWFANEVRQDQTKGNGNFLRLMNTALREYRDRVEAGR